MFNSTNLLDNKKETLQKALNIKTLELKELSFLNDKRYQYDILVLQGEINDIKKAIKIKKDS